MLVVPARPYFPKIWISGRGSGPENVGTLIIENNGNFNMA
jgi:hypothetical protein